MQKTTGDRKCHLDLRKASTPAANTTRLAGATHFLMKTLPEMRAETILNALRKARSNNLPPNEPSAVFVKVPQEWLEYETVRRGIYATVRDFLRNTQRVVTVVIYAVVVKQLKEEKMMLMRHRFHEFENFQHRFDKSQSWVLFRDYVVPEEWGGMPPKWDRVFSKGFLMRTK